MKIKILISSVLAISSILIGSAFAQNQNGNNGTNGQATQQQTANQGSNSQIQTQNTIQTQTGTQTQQQSANSTSTQTQNQNQTQSQNKYNAASAEQRRSQVANAVQEMLQVADRNSGIGQQVKIIAQTQNQNQEKLEVSLKKTQTRSAFAKFFIGANYGEINNAKKLLEQNREQIKQLNEVKTQLANQVDQQALVLQIQTLEQANLEIENSLNISQKGFSLFGWIFKWFAK